MKVAKTKTRKPTPNRWTTVYKGILAMKDKPVPQIFIERLADELLEWAENDERANNIAQFTSKRRISRSLLMYLCDNNPILKEAYTITLEILGSRRETGGLIDNWSFGMIKAVQHHYLPEWKDATHFKVIKDSNAALETSNASFLHQIILGNGEVINVGDGRK